MSPSGREGATSRYACHRCRRRRPGCRLRNALPRRANRSGALSAAIAGSGDGHGSGPGGDGTMASRLAQGSSIPRSDGTEPRVGQHLTRGRAIFGILGEQATYKVFALWRHVPNSSALDRIRWDVFEGSRVQGEAGGGGSGPTCRYCEKRADDLRPTADK